MKQIINGADLRRMIISAAAADLRKTEDPDLGQAAKVAASAMLRGARGNSGVILSLLFREMGIPEHLTCLLRNLYAGQEATVRTGHGTTDWFQNTSICLAFFISELYKNSIRCFQFL